jgi:hypothetical protein
VDNLEKSDVKSGNKPLLVRADDWQLSQSWIEHSRHAMIDCDPLFSESQLFQSRLSQFDQPRPRLFFGLIVRLAFVHQRVPLRQHLNIKSSQSQFSVCEFYLMKSRSHAMFQCLRGLKEGLEEDFEVLHDSFVELIQLLK